MKRAEFIKKLRTLARSRGIPDLTTKTMTEEDLLHDVLVCKTCGQHYVEDEDLDEMLEGEDSVKDFIREYCCEELCDCNRMKREKYIVPILDEMMGKMLKAADENDIDIEDMFRDWIGFGVAGHQSYLYKVVSDGDLDEYEYHSAISFKDYVTWISGILDDLPLDNHDNS